MVLSAAASFACSSGGPGRDRTGGTQAGPGYGPPMYGPGPQPTTSDSETPANPMQPDAVDDTPEVPGDELPLDINVSPLGSAMMGGTGRTGDRWHKTDVTRDGQNYYLMANGWGPNFGSQELSWNGTSFTVESMTGSQGEQYQPASYPTVFCGVYSDSRSRECGLPAALDSLTSLRTGWSWLPNGNEGEYNAAYDIWLGSGPDRSSFTSYMMVWYREPPGQQPAGSLRERAVTVDKVDGTWDIWVGTVNNRPIINWVRSEGQDTYAMEFDILDFVRDGEARGLMVPGTHVLSVAVGFEIWNGPVTNLESVDFYVDVQ